MNSKPQLRLLFCSRVCAIAVVCVAVLVLAGWVFDVHVLKSVLPFYVTMKANTAIGLLLGGCGLWIAGTRFGQTRWGRAAYLLCGVCMLALGALTLVEQYAHCDLHIDQLFFTDYEHRGAGYPPGRLAPGTAVCFLLLGWALVSVRLGLDGTTGPALGAAVLAGTALFGYAYGLEALYNIRHYVSIAVHTALCVVVLSLGLIAQRGSRLARLFGGSDEIARSARRLIVGAVLIPLLAGRLILVGERLGWYGDQVNLAICGMLNILLIGALVVQTSSRLRRLSEQRMRAETDQREATSRYEFLVNNIQEILWTAHPDGSLEYLSDSWWSYTGQSRTDLLDQAWQEAAHPEDRPANLARWRECLGTGEVFEAEQRIRGGEGHAYRWFLIRASARRVPEKGILNWVGTCTDIDDRKRSSDLLEEAVSERTAQLAESERRHRLMIEGVADYSILMLDPEGRITSWNSGAERLKQYTAAEAIGQHFSIFYPPELVLSGHPRYELECAVRDGSYREEGWRLRKDGSRFWANVLITRVLDQAGNVQGFSKVVRDLTEQKKAEEVLLSAQRRAEEANRAKSDFLAAMSHEIRTPMNAILGMADLLWESKLSPEQRQYVEIFRRAGGNLLTLVNDILDLSKIESGCFELEHVQFNLEELVKRTLEMLRSKAAAKQLALDYSIEPDVPGAFAGDPTRLQQVLINLLGNAVKFTETGSIALRIRALDAAAGHLRFEVIDTGIGIPADKLGSIFDDFTQAESSTTRRFGGTGLGLGICRRLVQRMGGELRVESEYGRGSCFSFDAHLEVSTEKEPLGRSNVQDLVGRRVLILDHNETTRLIFAEMFEHWGMESYESGDLAEAADILADTAQAQKPFELLVLDRQIAEDAFAFAAMVRSQYPSLPIILTTSDAAPGEATRARKLGCVDYIAKPIRRPEFLRAVCAVLGRTERGLEVASLQAGDQDAASPSAVTRRLLIAEDSEDNRFLLRAYLKSAPYELVFAENGQEAVAALRGGSFDLVLMDMQMPVMDGLTATEHIRALEQSEGRRAVPVIALTANARREDVDACLRAGCTAHLSKPIAKAKLLQAITQHVVPEPAGSATAALGMAIPSGFEEAARRYIGSRQNESIRLRELLEARDFESVRVLGHNMKGTGLSYGFPMITRLGGEIEAAARDQDLAALAEQVSRLASYVEQAAVLAGRECDG